MDSFKKLAGLKTLLIDDNQIVRDTLILAWVYKKCFIQAVASAEAGLSTLEKEHFDVIICDLRLPGINGVEFLKQAIQSHPDTIRVLFSGYGSEEIVAEAFEMGRVCGNQTGRFEGISALSGRLGRRYRTGGSCQTHDRNGQPENAAGAGAVPDRP